VTILEQAKTLRAARKAREVPPDPASIVPHNEFNEFTNLLPDSRAEWRELQARQEKSYRERVNQVLSAARRGKILHPGKAFRLPVGEGEGIPLDKDCDPNRFLLDTFDRAEKFAQKFGDGYAETPSWKALCRVANSIIEYAYPLLRQEGAGLGEQLV
jgi:hypothetical protein